MAEDQTRRERVLGSGGRLGVEERWPELFEPLDPGQRHAVVQSLASAWHECWVPNREDVENLTDKARGVIDREEYQRRTREAAERARQPLTRYTPR